MNLRTTQQRRQRPADLPRKFVLATLLGLALVSPVSAQQATSDSAPSSNNPAFGFTEADIKEVQYEEKILDFFPEIWTKDQKTPHFELVSLDPWQGPTSGKLLSFLNINSRRDPRSCPWWPIQQVAKLLHAPSCKSLCKKTL